jgi:hypothetical protein
MKMILLTQEQATQVKGNYGKYSALNPIQLDDSEFSSVKDLLLTLPQQEVTLLPPPELKMTK